MHFNSSSRAKLLVAIMAFALAAVVTFAAGTKPSMAKAPVPENMSAMADGGSDYAAYCARCHGGDGRGQTAKGRQTHAGDLTKSSVSDAKGVRLITHGSGEMPAFKDSMNADQIRGVMGYIRGFRR